MIFENIDFHNVSELTDNGDGGYTLHRFPLSVEADLSDGGKNANKVSTGVEFRFCMLSDTVTLKLKYIGKATKVTVYRGGVIGSWDEISMPIIGGEINSIVIKKKRSEEIKAINSAASYGFSHEVVRVVCNSATLVFYGVEGDVTPPTCEQLPSKTYLAYGSSITHGSNAVAIPASFAFRVAEHFRVDYYNLGLAGSARLEPSVVDHIADMGIDGKWDFATICMGINILSMEPDEFRHRVNYMVNTVTAKNPEKHVFFISPIFCHDDMKGSPRPALWREIIEDEVNKCAASNAHYINGLDLMGGAYGLSCDLVHPSPMGIDEITSTLIKEISKYVK